MTVKAWWQFSVDDCDILSEDIKIAHFGNDETNWNWNWITKASNKRREYKDMYELICSAKVFAISPQLKQMIV